VGTGARNVIPTMATAAIDIRLVKGNDPEHMQELVETHIEKQGYHVVRKEPDMETRRSHERVAMVTRGHGYPAARTSMSHPIVAPLTRAANLAAGGSVIQMPSLGGSLPLYLFNEKLDATVIILPIANHDDNQHAANENLRIANLWYGIDLMAAIFTME
jgi:acetylornithine deacetylase/succinyl-diaminopimelate desuccinylase-like protein